MIYYSHSMRIYGTPREEEEIKLIREHFPSSTVYNPNNTSIRAANCPMDACTQIINSERITRIVFSTYFKHIGKDVYTEIERSLELGRAISMIKGIKIVSFIGWSLRIVDSDDWIVRYAKVVKKGGDKDEN